VPPGCKNKWGGGGVVLFPAGQFHIWNWKSTQKGAWSGEHQQRKHLNARMTDKYVGRNDDEGMGSKVVRENTGAKEVDFGRKKKNKDAAAIVFVCCLWNLNGIGWDGRKQQLFLSIRRLKMEKMQGWENTQINTYMQQKHTLYLAFGKGLQF
jgi:hypothetical protein